MIAVVTVTHTSTISAAGPQKGANTHHQDHVMRLHNFKTTNTIPKAVNNPIPPELEEFDFIMYRDF